MSLVTSDNLAPNVGHQNHDARIARETVKRVFFLSSSNEKSIETSNKLKMHVETELDKVTVHVDQTNEMTDQQIDNIETVVETTKGAYRNLVLTC